MAKAPPRINLYSDTQTRPTPAMREAMAAAPCGDEQHFDDPTVAALCERMAALLGKEDAVYLPSGTMCNEIAILVQVRPGEEIIAHETAHIITSEGGGPGALAGAMIRPLSGPRGQFTAEQVAEAIRGQASRYQPRTRMVEIEQTANLGGGSVWPLAQINAVAEVAKANGLVLHMDGARLMNAVVASGVTAKDYAERFDSVWVDFTKGLGAPLGAVLAGSKDFIAEAWRWKQRLGGSMRQAGIVAAGCLHALDHHIDRLAEDHVNAKLLARDIAQIQGVSVVPPDTNLVFVTLDRPAQKVADALAGQGIWVSVMGERVIRLCTHLDVTAAQCAEAASALREVLARG